MCSIGEGVDQNYVVLYMYLLTMLVLVAYKITKMATITSYTIAE